MLLIIVAARGISKKAIAIALMKEEKEKIRERRRKGSRGRRGGFRSCDVMSYLLKRNRKWTIKNGVEYYGGAV
jgi:hypothetical protein